MKQNGSIILNGVAWRYRLTLSYGHGFQSFFSKKSFLSLFFLPGGDVVAENLFLTVHSYMYVENIESLYNYLSLRKRCFTCLIKLYLRLLITRLDWYCKVVLLFDL